MLYLGHFSFDGERSEDSLIPGETAGWFTLLVEAESADEALEKFSDLIESLDGRFEGFNHVNNIYLDDATEVGELPPEGVLARWRPSTRPWTCAGAFLSTSLPLEAPDMGWQPSRGAARGKARN